MMIACGIFSLFSRLHPLQQEAKRSIEPKGSEYKRLLAVVFIEKGDILLSNKK
jgi:hypothetical protein